MRDVYITVSRASRFYSTVFSPNTVSATNIKRAFENAGWRITYINTPATDTGGSVLNWRVDITASVMSNFTKQQIAQSAIAILKTFFYQFELKILDTADYTTYFTSYNNQSASSIQANQIRETTVNGVTYLHNGVTGAVIGTRNAVTGAVKAINTQVVLPVYSSVSGNLESAAETASGLDLAKIPFLEDLAQSLKISLPLALIVLILLGVVVLKR